MFLLNISASALQCTYIERSRGLRMERVREIQCALQVRRELGELFETKDITFCHKQKLLESATTDLSQSKTFHKSSLVKHQIKQNRSKTWRLPLVLRLRPLHCQMATSSLAQPLQLFTITSNNLFNECLTLTSVAE